MTEIIINDILKKLRKDNYKQIDIVKVQTNQFVFLTGENKKLAQICTNVHSKTYRTNSVSRERFNLYDEEMSLPYAMMHTSVNIITNIPKSLSQKDVKRLQKVKRETSASNNHSTVINHA